MIKAPTHVYHRIAEEVTKKHPQVTDEKVRQILEALDSPFCLVLLRSILQPRGAVIAVLAEARTYEGLQIKDSVIYKHMANTVYHDTGVHIEPHQLKMIIETPGTLPDGPDDLINDNKMRDRIESIALAYGIEARS
jgi:hypothetical protein